MTQVTKPTTTTNNSHLLRSKVSEVWKHAKKECLQNEKMPAFCILFMPTSSEDKITLGYLDIQHDISVDAQIKIAVQRVQAIAIFYIAETFILNGKIIPKGHPDLEDPGCMEYLFGILETQESGLNYYMASVNRLGKVKTLGESTVTRPQVAFGAFTTYITPTTEEIVRH